MITMNELVDLRMQQHIAQEIYRQQIMQRIPDPFPQMLPMAMPRHVIMPPRITLPGVEVSLQNDDLWKQFHGIGTEMIITKSGRRMFPSMRLSLSGLEDDSSYCVLLEMVPIGDCRYKFSGSQWVPAGGAEPQSPQRMCLHPDSPASGAHWQAQPILFNKVKLTNNTLDSNGHIVLASMHKYQPRIHVIRTADLTQIPWAPQQAFVFPETEFVAVTAYQNDRITKLKIDNNPFAKGFRETGQSRCKRKMSLSPSDEDQDQSPAVPQPEAPPHTGDMSPAKSTLTEANESRSSICGTTPPLPPTLQQPPPPPIRGLASAPPRHDDDDQDAPRIKRMRSNGSSEAQPTETSSPHLPLVHPHPHPLAHPPHHHYHHHHRMLPYQSPPPPLQQLPNVADCLALVPPPPPPANGLCGDLGIGATSAFMHHLQQNMQQLLRPSLVDLACISQYFSGGEGAGGGCGGAGNRPPTIYAPSSSTTTTLQQQHETGNLYAARMNGDTNNNNNNNRGSSESPSMVDVVETADDGDGSNGGGGGVEATKSLGHKKKGFSISAILGSSN